MRSHKVDITLIGESLDEGESLRAVCPLCNGGSSEEKSLSITRKDGDLVWQCFRAKCETRGATGNGGSHLLAVTKEPVKPKRKVWEGRTLELSEDHRQRITKLWGIDDPKQWWWTTDYGGRIAMSVRSPKFTHRGWVLRAITPTTGAKALTYIDEGEEGMSWYKTSPHTGTVLVEDIPSAVRASKYVNSVALLGTGIGMDRAIEIAENAPRPIAVALDQDATDMSFRWARKYGLLWGDVIVLPLKHDFKDMEDTDIESLLTRI